MLSKHKSTAYRTLVRPLLEYSSSVWDPYTTVLIKLEMVQRRTAGFCYNYYTYRETGFDRNDKEITNHEKNYQPPEEQTDVSPYSTKSSTVIYPCQSEVLSSPKSVNHSISIANLKYHPHQQELL